MTTFKVMILVKMTLVSFLNKLLVELIMHIII